MRQPGPWAFAAIVAVVAITTIGSGPAHAWAVGTHGYRIGGELIASGEKECLGVPNCLSATQPPTSVPAKGQAEARFACPASHPNVWGWDAAQHEHIFVKMVAVDRSTVTVRGVNAVDAIGEFAVSLGCSDQPYAGSTLQKSRQLAPTAHMAQRRAPRMSRGNSARHGDSQTGDSDACDGVPECQAGTPGTFSLGGWENMTVSYQCQSPYPYAWSYSYSQTGSPSVSAWGFIFDENPGTYDIHITNWNPFATDDVTIIVGCSKNNSISGNTCGNPQADPGCPLVPGSSKQYCSRGPVPVCFSVYQERCQPSNLLYQCTFDIYPWCQACPGQ